MMQTRGRGPGRGAVLAPPPRIGLFLLLFAVPSFAAERENGGVVSAPILQMPVGARAAGMGTAFTAVADDVSTLHYNPAGLTSLHQRELSLMQMSGQEGQSLQYFAGATPLPFAGFSGSGYATLGLSALLAGNGDLEVNTLNPDGTLAGTRNVSAGRDTVLTAGYAERIADTPFETPEATNHFEHFVGASGKFVRSSLADAYSAQTYAADAGYLVRAPELRFSLAAAVTNLGGRMKFVERSDPLPLALRLGGVYGFPLPESHGLRWAVDGQYEFYEKLWFVNTGLEYQFVKSLSARIGYQVHKEIVGLTFGFGAKWKNFGFDYGWGYAEDLGDTHRFGFSFRFGAVPIREREKPRRSFIESVPDRDELRDLERERPETYDQPKKPRRRAPDPAGAPGWLY